MERINRRKTHDQFLNDLYRVNPNREWELIGKYTLSKNPILIKDAYGECLMSPDAMLAGYNPSIKSAVNKEEYLIQQFKKKRSFLYDYSKIKYVNQKTKIEIVCEKHGSFWQSPDAHKKDHGCPHCFIEDSKLSEKIMMDALNSDNFDDSIVEIKDYRGSLSILSIVCSKGHCYENTYATRAYQKSGCPHCHNLYLYVSNNIEIKETIDMLFYIFKLCNKDDCFYKIGITKNIKNRIKDIKTKSSHDIEIIHQQKIPLKMAYNTEQKLKQNYKKFKRYITIPFGGHTECFTLDLPIEEIKEQLKFC